MSFAGSDMLRDRFHRIIPGGSHTYAKGDDQYPEHAAPFLTRGLGCRVWDVDGNEFIEYGMGLRTVTLGHGFRPVADAAYQQMLLGTNFTRPAVIELQCAEALLRLIGGAQMVKFAKDGSDTTTAAIKLARAFTGRDLIGVCAEHPFFSVDDWFIGSTAMNAGVPKATRELTVKFHYNDVASMRALFEAHPKRIAALIMEAAKETEPLPGFLEEAKRLCHEHGALLIFDEMITGFRWHLGGAQTLYGVAPDLSTFGKALGNGFSISALVGRRDIMELGGLRHEGKRVFLLSTTHGAETHALAAAIEVMRTYEREGIVERLYRQGERLACGVRQVTARHDLDGFFEVLGRPCSLIYATRDAGRRPSQEFRTLFLQELIRRGVLAPSFVVSAAHTDDDVDETIDVVEKALDVYRRALDNGIEGYVEGRPVKPVLRATN